MKSAITTISTISHNYRTTCKSEQSITPLRVPGGSQQHCLSKKSYTNNNLIESVIIEYKQLCQWVIREITMKLELNQIINNINKQLYQFERFLSKKLDNYLQEIQSLKLVHQEHQITINKLNTTNQDLKDKLKQISNNDNFNTTPLKRKQNYSIELITKQPLRNVSYSLQEQSIQDKENREIIIPKKKLSLKPKFKI